MVGHGSGICGGYHAVYCGTAIGGTAILVGCGVQVGVGATMGSVWTCTGCLACIRVWRKPCFCMWLNQAPISSAARCGWLLMYSWKANNVSKSANSFARSLDRAASGTGGGVLSLLGCIGIMAAKAGLAMS